MRRVGAVTVALLGALPPLLLFDGDDRSWAYRAYAVVVGAFAVRAVVRAVDRLGSRPESSPFAPARARRIAALLRRWFRRDGEPLDRTGLFVRSTTSTAGGVHHRLRPVLVEIADERLRARHGMTAADRRVEALVSSETWDLIRPDRTPPADRRAPGIEPRVLAAVLDDLEAL